jgi:hypothetical protein
MALTSVRRTSGSRETTDATPADYLARVQEIAPALAAAADEIDRRRELPETIVAALIERGLFRLLLPHSLDGAELLPAQYIPIIEAVAKVDASTAWCLNQNSGCSMTAALVAPEIAREIFGGARGILAWGPGPGEARIAPGGYRVTASWSFASGSQHASWLGCHVPIVEADGTPRLRADGTPVVRTMLFPKSSTEFCDIWHTIGLRGTASNQYSVKDLYVPEAYSVDVLSRRDGHRQKRFALSFQQPSLYAGVCRRCVGSRAACSAISSSWRAADQRNTLRNNNVIRCRWHGQPWLSSTRWLLQSFENITAAVAKRDTSPDERMNIRLASTRDPHPVEVVDALSGGRRDGDLRRPVRAAVPRRPASRSNSRAGSSISGRSAGT